MGRAWRIDEWCELTRQQRELGWSLACPEPQFPWLHSAVVRISDTLVF